jgi:hypothetical protein
MPAVKSVPGGRRARSAWRHGCARPGEDRSSGFRHRVCNHRRRPRRPSVPTPRRSDFKQPGPIVRRGNTSESARLLRAPHSLRASSRAICARTSCRPRSGIRPSGGPVRAAATWDPPTVTRPFTPDASCRRDWANDAAGCGADDARARPHERKIENIVFRLFPFRTRFPWRRMSPSTRRQGAPCLTRPGKAESGGRADELAQCG